jgi:hypothetical protein
MAFAEVKPVGAKIIIGGKITGQTDTFKYLAS